MEQNISNREKKNKKNNTGLIIAIIAAVTVVLVIAIVLVGKSIANKKIAEIQEKAEIVEQVEPEDNTEVEEDEIEETGEVSEKQVEETKTPETIAEDVSKVIKESASAENSEQKKMTDDEFTLCWYNDKYLNHIPLMGLGIYETILQKDNFSTAIISGLTKDDIKKYCEHKGAEGDLDLRGFTKGAMITSDKENVYSYQVSNKDGITVYISWADGVAAFTVGEE